LKRCIGLIESQIKYGFISTTLLIRLTLGSLRPLDRLVAESLLTCFW